MTWGTHCSMCGREDCDWTSGGTCEGASKPPHKRSSVNRTDYILMGLCAAAFAVIVISTPRHARAAEDPRKEYLRLQATEFCSVVKPPPPGYIEFLTKQVEADPKSIWAYVLAREAVLGQRYTELHCGES